MPPKKSADGPKRPKNAYMLFSGDNRKEMTAKNPSAKTTEIVKMLAAAWKKADEATKKKYEGLAAKERERYNSQKK
jgi:hypothetical protein